VNNRYLALAAALSVATAFAGDDALQPRKLLDGKVTMLVPAGFTVMADEQRKLKYPGPEAPALVLTDESTAVNIALDHKSLPIRPEELPELEATVRKQMEEAKLNSSGLRKLNGREFAVFDLDSDAPDGTVRNIMAMTSLDGKLLIVSYNCMVSRDAGCGVLGTRLIESIEVTGP
jgi:hypothetical protein